MSSLGRLRLLSKKRRNEEQVRKWDIRIGDCVKQMMRMDTNSVDCVVCDPPYGLEFMGKEFDKLGEGPKQQEWHRRWAEQALRVLKPGGHLLAFGGTRTYHRLVCALEDAGFEIRDQLAWMYGSGFPKSLDISKAIDKEAGAEREVVGYRSPFPPDHPRPNKNFTRMAEVRKAKSNQPGSNGNNLTADGIPITAPATPAAEKWQGWGTALKPAHEPICMARKPLRGTVARNVLKHGTGGINVDGCRVETLAESFVDNRPDKIQQNAYGKYGTADYDGSKGRFPSNVILTHHPECEKRGVKKVKGVGGGDTTPPYASDRTWSVSQTNGQKRKGFADEDGMETVEDWDCHPDCPVRILDEQSGITKSSDSVRHNNEFKSVAKGRDLPHETQGHSDAGGASRFFKTIEADPDLKPEHEPICMARKPLEGTVAKNVLEHGTGGLNIDGCRVGTTDKTRRNNTGKDGDRTDWRYGKDPFLTGSDQGRWPANVILTHHPECKYVGIKRVKGDKNTLRNRNTKSNPYHLTSDEFDNNTPIAPSGYADKDGLETIEDWECHPECPVRILNEQSGELTSGGGQKQLGGDKVNPSGWVEKNRTPGGDYQKDTGGASRFFYCAKASKAERNMGVREKTNTHPTVKPIALMQYLIKLVCPTHGVVLDPFCGSGTTIIAAMREKMNAVGIEQDEEYAAIARARVEEETRRLLL